MFRVGQRGTTSRLQGNIRDWRAGAASGGRSAVARQSTPLGLTSTPHTINNILHHNYSINIIVNKLNSLMTANNRKAHLRRFFMDMDSHDFATIEQVLIEVTI